MKTDDVVVATHFDTAFSLRTPDGWIRRFGVCEWHDDPSWKVVRQDGAAVLIKEGSRDEGFQEISREILPNGTEWTFGFHDYEHGDWRKL